MSRSFYNSPTQKKVVDAIASKRSQIAIANSRRAGEAKAKVNRERKLGIAPPPAQFQTAADAAFDVAHNNQVAIQTLESFMYPKDALNAFGDLLKHNQINEFNAYSSNFKKALGDRKISYIEFTNYWQTFIDRLQDDLNEKALYLTPAEKKEFEQNANLNIQLAEFSGKYPLLPSPPILPIKRTKPTIIGHLEAPAEPFDYSKISRSELAKLDSAGDTLKLWELFKKTGRANPPGLTFLVGGQTLNSRNGTWQINLDLLRNDLLTEDTTDHPFGEGLKRTKRMYGRGLTQKSTSNLKHRFEVLSGEVQAGNDNPAVVSELYELIDILRTKNMIKQI